MPVTVSYDVTSLDPNQRNYIRSMLERFNWRRLGGSVFRYDGTHDEGTGELHEDWLNDVAPALMFFRSYLLKNNISLKYFTLDASGVSHIDHSDSSLLLGSDPKNGSDLPLNPKPTNPQSSEKAIRGFVDAARDAAG